MELIRLTPETEIKPFDCDDTDLNGFLFDDAKNYGTSLLAVTYLLQDEKNTIAYFAYQNDKISHTDIGGGNTKAFAKRVGSFLPLEKGEFKSYPAVKIGRLAVSTDYKGKGHGKQIIQFTIRYFTEKNKTGCKFITVDAYKKSLEFYEKMGFKYLSSADKNSDTRLMYYNLEAF